MVPQRRLAYNADFKLKAINHAKEHGNRAAAREFNINGSMVRKWRKQDDDLRLAKTMKKSFHGNKVRWLQLEDRLDLWISEQRAAGRNFSTVTVWIKAKVMANEMDINDFKAGPSWCFRFMKRWQLSICTRTMVSQQLPADYEEKLSSFWSYCKSKIAEKNIQPDHIINMDKVALTFDMLLNQTVERTGTSTVSICTQETKRRRLRSSGIIPGLTSDGIESTKTDDSDDEDMGDTGSGLLDAATTQMMISGTEGKEFEGFMADA
ncbi:hypothetical protein TURU_045834 [Turdus rufiventris]|nr:hypothetical protein TURU_045834 [Turdus rufiventris]